MISVVVLTWNEASNLPRCLASVKFSDDVLVVDSGSHDATVDIARAAGARVCERPFDSFAGQRNFAMEQDLRHRWVLHVDADEVVTPELAAELQEIVNAEEALPVYRVPSRLIFLGRWLRHAGMYPCYQVRFGRVEHLRFIDHGHGQREVQPAHEVGTLKAPLDHYNFSKGVNDWMTRHLRYARLEAAEILNDRSRLSLARLFDRDPTTRRRALKRFAAHMPLRPWLRFLHVYVLRGGFLDGRAGLHYARLLGTYQYLIDLNLEELRAALSNSRS